MVEYFHRQLKVATRHDSCWPETLSVVLPAICIAWKQYFDYCRYDVWSTIALPRGILWLTIQKRVSIHSQLCHRVKTAKCYAQSIKVDHKSAFILRTWRQYAVPPSLTTSLFLRIEVFLKYAMLMLPFIKIDEKDFSEALLLRITSHTSFRNSIIDWENHSSQEALTLRLVTLSEVYGVIIVMNSRQGWPSFIANSEFGFLPANFLDIFILRFL